ncbi:MAG: hypothetical protein U9N33_03675 [Campylobacterota bacterium]|nr:hypothetical protein [Campylobacterota bacterium]
MTQPITIRVQSKILSLSNGVVFASNSFRFVDANQNSVEKELSKLNADGVIKRFRKGIFKRINAKKLTTSNKRVALVLSAIDYLGKDAFSNKDLVGDFW